jgi:diaminohydroxyphosphoribosylaminopyrimidine deaminase/5-amino-6-(5-phosphoribosylamino)uracil reductase
MPLEAIGEPPENTFMRLAISEMKKCQEKPKVGVVIVKYGKVVATGYRQNGVHGERVAIETAIAAGIKLNGATLFTTLEPCVHLGSKIAPCATLIAQSGIKQVYIGRYDAHPEINRVGWKTLTDAGIVCKDFTADLRNEIDELNAEFTDCFEQGTGPKGGAKFDYNLNGGNFDIRYSANDPRTIQTRWTLSGHRSIQALASHAAKVGLAKHAKTFDQIDDPTALDFSKHVVRPKEGEIVVFLSDTGCALVRIEEVHSGPDYGSDHTSLKIKFQVRAWQRDALPVEVLQKRAE